MTATTAHTMQANQVRGTTGTGRHVVIDVALCWRETDPLVIRMMACQRGCDVVVWDLDRDMLAQGLDMPVGIGDISIMPDLSRRDGLAVELVFALVGRGVGYNLSLPLLTAPLRRYLDRTYAVVPAGVELDVDPADIEAAQ